MSRRISGPHFLDFFVSKADNLILKYTQYGVDSYTLERALGQIPGWLGRVAERRVIPGLEVYPNFTTAVLLDIFCRHPETIALSYGFDTGAIQTIETEEGWRVETTSDNRIIAYC